MNTSDYTFFARNRWKEALVTALAKWIPSSPGRVIRKLLYHTIFDQVGDSVEIQHAVDFLRADGIKIGDRVSLESGVRLLNRGRNNKIAIGDKTKLNSGVRLQNYGCSSQILIGSQVNIDRGVDVKAHHSGTIEIGDKTFIGPYTCLSGKFIRVGRQCLIASHTGIYAINHNFADPNLPIQEQGVSYKGIVIEDDCWLGTGVRILDGVTIGQGSVIGAGAVVTKDVPSYSVAVGVPAQAIANRRQDSEFQIASNQL